MFQETTTNIPQNVKHVDLSFLDEIHIQMREESDNLAAYFSRLVRSLFGLRQSLNEANWKYLIPEIIKHPIRQLLYQDPFTLRCFQKPRGYAGDAVMMDYIYDCIPPAEITETGRTIFLQATKQHPGCRGVRHRRAYLAQIIDEMALYRDRLKILSVACGHLREAELSQTVRERNFDTFIALDQDMESLEYIDKRQYAPGIRTTRSTIMDILLGKFRPDTSFDLVYAAGLYDYLSDRIAQKLTQRLFELINPGGKLLIPNLSYMPDIAYMESFMDWHFICRYETEMHNMYARVPEEEIEDVFTFIAPNKTVIFLEIDKRS